jgi:PII-like signaling protein
MRRRPARCGALPKYTRQRPAVFNRVGVAKALPQTFREAGFAGATVTRAVAGFGASAVVHTERLLRMSLDLPLVVELDRMIGGGLVTSSACE